MAVNTSTGVKFSVVAGEPATHDEAGFAALSFVDVEEITDIPEYGSSTTVVEHMPLKDGVTKKFKGFINYGSTTLALGRDATDAGQAILQAGNDGATKNDEHSFQITFPDGSIQYTTGKIFSYTTNPGSANSIVGSSVTIEINTVIVEVAAP